LEGGEGVVVCLVRLHCFLGIVLVPCHKDVVDQSSPVLPRTQGGCKVTAERMAQRKDRIKT
jgi:hypothetical protein